MNYKLLILCLALIAIVNVYAFAQEPTPYESEGIDFWFTFMPNYHNTNHSKTDSLYILVTSKYATKGTIDYVEETSVSVFTSKTINFEITEPNQIYKLSLWYDKIALLGYNQGNTLSLNGSNAEVITTKRIHIVTDEKSTVYALDYAEMTAEAFIVLPTPALGKEYFIMSYPSDVNYYYSSLQISSTPSQFAIVATEDNTIVAITPKEPTQRHDTAIQNIVLNKGDVYLVQAKMSSAKREGDLTGTHIVSDKNIAVFAGHQRTSVPIGAGSRDCLIEQLIPVHSWGKNSIITPFLRSNNYCKYNVFSDIFRVLSCKNNTTIKVNNEIVATLDAGEYYEDTLRAAIISSDNPIMVASYCRTETPGSNIEYSGDPFMIIIPPIEQYKADYNVISSQFSIAGHNFITDQFLTIIVPDVAVEYVYLDDNLLNPNIFVQILSSGYSYAQIRTKDGGHNITCKEPVSVQVYGYGSAVSYGYLGGMSFKDLEHDKIALYVDECLNSATFVVNETYNSGIVSYDVVKNENCIISADSISKWKLILNISKKDNAKIAYFTINIVDLYGDTTTFTDTIHTNMYNIANINEIVNFGECKVVSPKEKQLCLVNTGDTPVLLSSGNFVLACNTLFTIPQSQFPILINVGDSVWLNIVYAPISSRHSKDIDTLVINTECINHTLVLEASPIADTFKFNGFCSVPIVVTADSIIVGIAPPIILPNPVSDEAVYKFNTKEDNSISIKLYNEIGTLMTSVFDGFLSAGVYEIFLSINNLASGNYFVELSSNKERFTTKMVIR